MRELRINGYPSQVIRRRREGSREARTHRAWRGMQEYPINRYPSQAMCQRQVEHGKRITAVLGELFYFLPTVLDTNVETIP
jgi:hypothetical protein